MKNTIYISEKEAADYSGFSVSALRKFRREKTGIPYIKTDTGSIRYTKQDIDNYMDKHRVSDVK